MGKKYSCAISHLLQKSQSSMKFVLNWVLLIIKKMF